MADGEIAQDESTWVRFLVRNLDGRTLKLIRKDAFRRKLSVQDWMRTILCNYYELDCEKAKRFSAKRAKSGHARTFLLRLQPALWQAVKDDAAERGISMQIVVREILEHPYAKKEAVT
jgi:plasmid stability protein